jgi:hypothetical protein
MHFETSRRNATRVNLNGLSDFVRDLQTRCAGSSQTRQNLLTLRGRRPRASAPAFPTKSRNFSQEMLALASLILAKLPRPNSIRREAACES